MGQIASAVRWLVLARLRWPWQVAFVVGSIATASYGRHLLDSGANGVPFASYFPFIVVGALLLDLRYAVLLTIGCMFAAAALFLRWDDPSPARASLALTYLLTTGLIVGMGQILRKTVHDLDAKARELQTFNSELQHRAKNALQIVSALASRGARSSTPEQFFEDFTGRIGALVRANNYLGITSQSSGDLARLIEIATEPFDRSAICAAGPPCTIAGNVGTRLMMILHELSTNATKYGALSKPGGTVHISWTLDGDSVRMHWREQGGPPVEPPARTGLGTRLLTAQGPRIVAKPDFREAGFECEIAFGALAGTEKG